MLARFVVQEVMLLLLLLRVMSCHLFRLVVGFLSRLIVRWEVIGPFPLFVVENSTIAG